MNTTTQRSDTACDNAVGQFSHAHMGIVMQLDRLATLPALLAPARMAQDTAQRTVDFFVWPSLNITRKRKRSCFPPCSRAHNPAKSTLS